HDSGNICLEYSAGDGSSLRWYRLWSRETPAAARAGSQRPRPLSGSELRLGPWPGPAARHQVSERRPSVQVAWGTLSARGSMQRCGADCTLAASPMPRHTLHPTLHLTGRNVEPQSHEASIPKTSPANPRGRRYCSGQHQLPPTAARHLGECRRWGQDDMSTPLSAHITLENSAPPQQRVQLRSQS
ncbi:hypothetical protein BU16DRAFT_595312, partial [Lophium mytilinum]